MNFSTFRVIPLLLPVAATVMVATATEQAAFATVNPEQKLEAAAETLEQFIRNPQDRIPAKLLQESQGIVIVPNVVQAGFLFGGRRGSGVVLVRDELGNWSNPAFVSLTGGSFGLQIGAQSSDVILLLRTRNAVNKLLRESFNLGGNVSVAAGPVGGDILNPTDPNAQIYSYARNSGLFAGVAIEGAKIAFDPETNQKFYGRSGLTARQIFGGGLSLMPASQPALTDLRQVLAQAQRQAQPGLEFPPQPQTPTNPQPQL